MTTRFLQKRGVDYVLAILSIAIVTASLAPFHDRINSTTVALALLLAVLFIATGWGSKPALLASVLGVLCFNFFFLPPVGTLTIADPENWVALVAFLITAITAGQLSSRARRRAVEAEIGKREIERLYNELRSAFERASHAEALRQSEQLKSALLDAVTHDLRTPLTSIKASATTLLGEINKGESTPLDNEGRRELLEVIDEETDRLNHFIEGLVEMARIEAGEMHLRRRWVVIDEIIASALKRAEPLTVHHNIKVIIASDLPAIRIDAQAISEVVYSLIDNATKFAPAATDVTIIAERNDVEMIRVSVEDQGPGVSPENRQAVFDKFFRTKDEAAKQAGRAAGIGMGLAIAHGIIDAHGGRIWIESGTKGRGAKAIFTLPIGDDEGALKTEVEVASPIDEARSVKS
jgi:two-component system sensor histidine kinase KdpD